MVSSAVNDVTCSVHVRAQVNANGPLFALSMFLFITPDWNEMSSLILQPKKGA